MDNKWIKAGVIGTYLCLAAQMWGVFKPTNGSAPMIYLPFILTVVSALLVIAATLISFGMWPFSRWSTGNKYRKDAKSRSLAFRIMLEKCQFLIKSYIALSSNDPEHTKKPLSADDSWHQLEENERWTYTQLSLLRYAQDYCWLLNTAKKSFAEMGWEDAPFFTEKPYFLLQVQAALQKFEALLDLKITSLEEQK